MTALNNRKITVLDDFYSFKQDVNADEYDVASSYFNDMFGDQETARNFTATLFRIAAETGEPVLSMLDELSGKDQLELSYVMAYYLNRIRSLTVMLGVEVDPPPNEYAARNVLP